VSSDAYLACDNIINAERGKGTEPNKILDRVIKVATNISEQSKMGWY